MLFYEDYEAVDSIVDEMQFPVPFLELFTLVALIDSKITPYS